MAEEAALGNLNRPWGRASTGRPGRHVRHGR